MAALEREQARVRRKALYLRKLKRATHLLFYRRHRKPGVKGWELRKRLGADYPKVLDLLDSHLEKLDLQVKTVFEEDINIAKQCYFDMVKDGMSELSFRGIKKNGDIFKKHIILVSKYDINGNLNGHYCFMKEQF